MYKFHESSKLSVETSLQTWTVRRLAFQGMQELDAPMICTSRRHLPCSFRVPIKIFEGFAHVLLAQRCASVCLAVAIRTYPLSLVRPLD